MLLSSLLAHRHKDFQKPVSIIAKVVISPLMKVMLGDRIIQVPPVHTAQSHRVLHLVKV